MKQASAGDRRVESEFYRRAVFRVVAAQLATALTVTALIAVIFGLRPGYSALVGVVIGVLPSHYAATRLFRVGPDAPAERVLGNVYVAEVIKILLTAALFVIALLALDVNVLAVAATYVSTIVVYWLALLFLQVSRNESVS